MVRTIAERIGRGLERAGLITRDIENAYLNFDPSEEAPTHSLARLVAAVPKPRAHLSRYHGVFAPASALRDRVVPKPRADTTTAEKSDGERHRALTWAKRLKRVFAIEIERCFRCGARLRVIASIDEPDVIERILAHLKIDHPPLDLQPPSRAPPPGKRPF